METSEAVKKYRQSEKGIATRRRNQREYYHRNREAMKAKLHAGYLRNKESRRSSQKSDYASDPEKYRRWQLWSAYRVTPERFNELFAKQDGKCPCGYIFQLDKRDKTGAHVDHNHSCCPGVRSCGKCVRGLLCRNCNRALGLLKDSPELLRKLIAWLEK